MIYKMQNYFKKLNESADDDIVKITRDDLKKGDTIMTIGNFEGLTMDHQIGKILKMNKYGKILVEFVKPFNKLLHSGHENIGKDKHCYYIDFNNILSNDESKFKGILNRIQYEKEEIGKRTNIQYKQGDIIVGVNYLTKNPSPVNVNGQIGLVYYVKKEQSLNNIPEFDKNNQTYWIGFVDYFSNKLTADNSGYPQNRAGIMLDKTHIRHITPEEIELNRDKIDKIQKVISDLKDSFGVGDVLMVTDKYRNIDFEGKIGIVIADNNNRGGIKKEYVLRFLDKFDENLIDLNYMIGERTGFILPKSLLRRLTEEEKINNKDQIEKIRQKIIKFNYNYKEGDYVILNLNDMDADYGYYEQHSQYNGHLFKIIRSSYGGQYTIEKIFNYERSHKIAINIHKKFFDLAEDINIDELKEKIENFKIVQFESTSAISAILARMKFSIKNVYLLQSYFDVTDKNDVVTFLPINKIKIAEGDPYKSRLRQPSKIGKFLKMLNPDMTDKNLEDSVNAYKANYDIVINKSIDKLKIVSGEDIRFWYNEKNYVKGGGSLNSSCMRGANKAPEMQMFVDNPDVIQMLILLNDDNKLLGRALLWRLVEPAGKTYMDYIYTRYTSDDELFKSYGVQNNFIMAHGRTRDMICALNTDKKYKMGVNALDHFDTLNLVPDGNYLTTGKRWTRPPKPKLETEVSKGQDGVENKKVQPEELPFLLGTRVQYRRNGAINNNKYGKFAGMLKDKIKIIFDDGVKFAAVKNNVYLAEDDK